MGRGGKLVQTENPVRSNTLLQFMVHCDCNNFRGRDVGGMGSGGRLVHQTANPVRLNTVLQFTVHCDCNNFRRASGENTQEDHGRSLSAGPPSVPCAKYHPDQRHYTVVYLPRPRGEFKRHHRSNF